MSFSNQRVTIPSIRKVIDDKAWVEFGNAANRGQLTDESQFQVFLLPALQTILHLSSHLDRISVETGFDMRRVATTSERWDAMAMHSTFRECDAEWSEREKKRKAEKMEEASLSTSSPFIGQAPRREPPRAVLLFAVQLPTTVAGGGKGTGYKDIELYNDTTQMTSSVRQESNNKNTGFPSCFFASSPLEHH